MMAETPRRKKPRFTISRKASLGYVVLLTLLFLTSGISLVALSRLNALNQSIIRSDIPVVTAADRLVEVLLAEEHYARRTRILGTPDIREVFNDKGREFDAVLGEVREVADQDGLHLGQIDLFHSEYRRILNEWLDGRGRQFAGQPGISERDIRVQQERLVGLIKTMADGARRSHRAKTEQIGAIGSAAFRIAATFCGIGLVIALFAAVLITRSIAGTIQKLKLAAGRIVQGDFENIPVITRKDELGAVAVAFIGMAKRLRHLEDAQRKSRFTEAMDPGPAAAQGTPEDLPAVRTSDVRGLTGLPTGKAVIAGLRGRVQEKSPFAYCVVRIENLKAYNDRYDWGKGDTMVQAVAGVIEDAVRDKGGEGDLVGHKLGAQFVILTTPERFPDICRTILKDFEEAAPFFYDPEDREQGFITGTAPGGATAVYPLATLSIAVVTSESPDARTADHAQVAAGRLLEWARTQGGNMYVVNSPD